jgi:hypothetical protein
MDEKPFKRLMDESFDEQARQEVLQEDVIDPLMKTLRQREEEQRAEAQRKKTQNMAVLSNEATIELDKLKSYPAARPFSMRELGSYGLSTLADVAEWNTPPPPPPPRNYTFARPANGNAYPPSAIDFRPPTGYRPTQAAPPPPPPPPPPQHTYQQVLSTSSRPRGRRLKYPPLSPMDQVLARNFASVLPGVEEELAAAAMAREQQAASGS